MTRLELRRLALRSTRDPRTWLPVLQDALHETYGVEFEQAVEYARAWAAREKRSGHTIVGFAASPKLPQSRYKTIPFEVYVFTGDDEPDRLLRAIGRVPVFIAENVGR